MTYLMLNGVRVVAKQYFGIGPLNVQTSRGEVRAQSSDFILMFPDGASCVIPESTFNLLDLGSKPEQEAAVKTEPQDGKVAGQLKSIDDSPLASTASSPATQKQTSPATNGGESQEKDPLGL